MTHVHVKHFGPDPRYVGGMGSVLRVLIEHRIGCDSAQLHVTWRPNAPIASAALSLRALGAVLRMRRGQIAHVHLSEKGSFIREGAILVFARLRGVGAVTTIHGAEFTLFSERHRRITFGVLRRAHLILCLDRDIVERVRRYVPDATVELLPNPVSMDDASPCADETAEIVLFAGEISRRKGADVLLTAWRQVLNERPEAQCLLVGPSGDVEVPPCEKLEARPPVAQPAMRALMRTARVITLPSRAEGMPMALTEAMSAGRPFVSTPVGGIPELARSGGVLVPVGDHGELARRLIELLADPGLARVIGEEGRGYCAQTRSVAVIDERLRALYAIVRRRPGGDGPSICARPYVG